MVDTRVQNTLWNYIVFNRVSLAPNENRTGYTEKYIVNIIRENYIPEGLELQVINKMLEIAGMKLSSGDGVYTYLEKQNTNIVIEMFSVEFVRAKKAKRV